MFIEWGHMNYGVAKSAAVREKMICEIQLQSDIYLVSHFCQNT